jgi:hypothetical protein
MFSLQNRRYDARESQRHHFNFTSGLPKILRRDASNLEELDGGTASCTVTRTPEVLPDIRLNVISTSERVVATKTWIMLVVSKELTSGCSNNRMLIRLSLKFPFSYAEIFFKLGPKNQSLLKNMACQHKHQLPTSNVISFILAVNRCRRSAPK